MGRVLWDRSKCVGCRMCEAVCSLTHDAEFNPTKSRIKVVRRIEDGALYPVAVRCMHCEQAFCMIACPVGALSRDERGAVMVNEKRCIGCKLCETACPIGGIAVHPETHVAMKCDLCAGLAEPQCAKYCSWRYAALSYVPAETAGKALATARAEKFVEMAQRGQ